MRLSHFDIPEGIVSLEAYSIWAYGGLFSLSFPSTLKYVRGGGIGHQVRSITIHSNNTYLSSPTGYEVIDYNKRLVWISPDLNVEEYHISINAEFFASHAMAIRNDYIKKLYIPSSINTISYLSINLSTSSSVIFESDTPPVIQNEFASFGVIYVPDSAVDTYKAVANLAAYKDRIYPMSQL